MRYLGIDYGSKRVGVAISDPDGSMAFPRLVMQNTRALVDDVVRLATEEGVETIVVGESVDYKGKDNPIMARAREFALAIGQRGFQTAFIPEHLTSREAAHIQGENDLHDASAAAIILQSYLDRENPRPRNEEREELG